MIELKLTKESVSDVTIDDLALMENGTCTEININNILCKLTHEEVVNLLHILIQKLTPTGTVSITGLDIIQTAYHIIKRDMINPNLSASFSDIKSVISLEEITALMTQTGFVIKNKLLNGLSYNIMGTKNES